ncbi:LamG domain-containing protein [Winogradskya humida]
MWDSRSSQTLAKQSPQAAAAVQGADDDRSTAATPADTAQTGVVQTELTAAGDLVLKPDQQMLTGSPTFPVFIDPYWSKGKTRWAYATNNNTNNSDVSRARVGMDPDGRIYRAFFEFPTTELKGKYVHDAHVEMKLDHSWSCVDTWTHMYSASPITATPRQTWKKSSPFLTHLSAAESHANEGGGCADSPQPDMIVNFRGQPVIDVLRTAANKGSSSVTMTFSAGNDTQEYESDGTRWKKFFPSDAKLIAEIDNKPGKPGPLEVNQVACQSTSIAVGVVNPYLSAYLPDGDNGQALTVTWELYKVAADWTKMTPPPVSSSPANAWEFSSRIAGAVNDQMYAFRVKTQDPAPYQITSAWSDWCYFRIDLMDPQVSATVITQPAGPGLPGTVKITSTSNDVTTFRYGWSAATTEVAATTVSGQTGKSATVTVTAPKYGDNILFLQAIDTTRNVGDGSVRLTAGGEPHPAVAHWGLEAYPGVSKDVALQDQAKALGTDLGLTAAPGMTWADKQRLVGAENVALSGTNSGLATSRGVLDTTKSYSVAAWVRLDSLTNIQAVVSQDGEHVTNFQIQYRNDDRNGDGTPDKSFCFGMRGADQDSNATGATVCAVNTAVAGRWTHVAGGYDAGDKKVRIWVNGVKTEAASTAAWPSTKPLRIGSRKITTSTWTDYLTGSVADVQAFDRVLVDKDFVGEKYPAGANIAPDPGILQPVRVGDWDFEAGIPCYYAGIEGVCQAPDTSLWGRQLSLTEGTDIGDSPEGKIAEFDDVSLTGDPATTHEYGLTQQNNSTSEPGQWQETPVLRTDQSYTVSVNVMIDKLENTMTALAPKGDKMSAFYLGTRRWTVDGVDAYRFMAAVPNTDQDSGQTYTNIVSKDALDIGDAGAWTRLTLVYDAGAATMTLYLNGEAADTQKVGAMWNAAGPLTVGGGWWTAPGGPGSFNDQWYGGIDDIEVFQGAMTAVQVDKLSDS